MPPQRRLLWARLWPAVAAVNGVLAMSGLRLWPEGSGVHLLLFLAVFWLGPLVCLCWTGLSALVLNRAPFWRRLVTPHQDGVVTLWCARQALLAQAAFCLAGLGWLWLMLAGQEVVFYWSTTLPVVATYLGGALKVLSLDLVDAPDPLIIGASRAGAISGWQDELLAYANFWAAWLSVVVALWIGLPWLVLLAVTQVRLRRRLRHWPDWNPRLARLLRIAAEPRFEALQAQEAAPARSVAPALEQTVGWPAEPGFAWQVPAHWPLPEGSQPLGQANHAADLARIDARASELTDWYLPDHLVPTGDLADLIAHHRRAGGSPRLTLLSGRGGAADADTLARSWHAFIERNALDGLPLRWFVTGGDDDDAG